MIVATINHRWALFSLTSGLGAVRLGARSLAESTLSTFVEGVEMTKRLLSCHSERERRIFLNQPSRRPGETTLYRLVQENLETFLAQVEAERGSGLPESSSIPSSPAAFWRTGFSACAVASAATTSWWPSHASGAAFAPLAARGTWRKTARPPGRLRDPAGPGAPMGIRLSSRAQLMRGGAPCA